MIATALNIAERQVNNTLTLLEGGGQGMRPGVSDPVRYRTGFSLYFPRGCGKMSSNFQG